MCFFFKVVDNDKYKFPEFIFIYVFLFSAFSYFFLYGFMSEWIIGGDYRISGLFRYMSRSVLVFLLFAVIFFSLLYFYLFNQIFFRVKAVMLDMKE